MSMQDLLQNLQIEGESRIRNLKEEQFEMIAKANMLKLDFHSKYQR